IMARHKHSGEVNIGSDSFLDVIANIVGILIILIVVAGIRVHAVPKKKPSRVVEPPVSAEPAHVEIAAAPVPRPEPPPEPAPEPEEPLEPEYVEQTDAPADLTQKLASIQTEIDKLEAAAKTTLAAKSELEQRQARGELQISAGRSKLQSE